MDTLTAVIFLFLAVILAVLVWVALLLRRGRSDRGERLEAAVELLKAELLGRQSESILALRASLDDANKIINDRLAEGTTSLDRRMAVLGEIENHLGRLSTQATNIETLGRNIQSLSDLLRPPKLRGSVGELFLENLLAQILPRKLYEIQYRFSTGVRVDAVVRLGDMLLPIDAKFPLESFERLRREPGNPSLQKEFARTLRKHVDDIASKYIRPAENTTPFAIMYIPAEAVYHQLVTQADQDGFDYALSRRIIPSSPGHLYAFLSSLTVIHAELTLAGGELARDAREMTARIDQLVETTERLTKFHTRMEGSLRSLSAAFDHARKSVSELRGQLAGIRAPYVDDAESMNEE